MELKYFPQGEKKKEEILPLKRLDFPTTTVSEEYRDGNRSPLVCAETSRLRAKKKLIKANPGEIRDLKQVFNSLCL